MTEKVRQIALLASVALNLLMIGAAASFFFSERPPRMDRSVSPAGLESMIFALPEDDRRKLLRDLRLARAEFRRAREEYIANREALIGSLTAQPLDMARVEDLIKAQRDLAFRTALIGEKALIARISAMQDDALRDFANTLEYGREREHRDEWEKSHRERPERDHD